MNKPKSLKRGDKVAIVSLSSGLLGEEFCGHTLALGKKRLEELGLQYKIMPNALKGIDYLKEHPEERAKDLKQAMADPEIKGIICAIGGDDTYRLLPYLLEDKEFVEQVKKTPKLFTGFSDTTINHLMFYGLGMMTYYGPNFICDLAEMDKEMIPYTKNAFLAYLGEREDTEICSSEIWYEERTDFSADQLGKPRISHSETKGYEVLQGSGTFSGRLLGGCLESIYDILSLNRYPDEREVCEKYHLFPSKEEWKGKILFIETCEEKPEPEVFRKELMTLRDTGIFEVVNGVLVGKPQDEAYYEEYKKVYSEVIENKDLPILFNINFGHATPRGILPYGSLVEVDLDQKRIYRKETLFQK